MEQKPTGYYDGVNAGLLDSIPLEARVVLEIGCGSGNLGAAYKERNPNATYYGVEVIEAAAARAAERLDKVFWASAEDVDLSELKGTVDCVVYGDVLEHLLDPWTALKNHASLLAEGGRIFACIPNVQHWTLLQHVLQGNWVYHDHGILDSTHLRFFTLKSIYTMFAGAGLRIDNVIGLQVNQPVAALFVDKMKPALDNLGIDATAFLQQTSALQYLVSATRPGSP